jgi:hypothetical protein
MNEDGNPKTHKSAESGAHPVVLGLSPVQWSVLSSIITVLSSAGIIIAIVGVVLAYREQLSNEKFRQIKESLAIISHWEDQSLYNDYETIFNHLRDFYENYKSLDVTSEIVQEHFFAPALEIYTHEDGGLPKFKRVDRYFNRLGLCAKSSVCDEDLILDYFHFEINGWQNLTSLAERSQHLNYNTGTGTKYLFELSDEN